MDTDSLIAPTPDPGPSSATVPAGPGQVEISPLARQFAEYLHRACGESDPSVLWAARLACQAVAEGRVCLNLEHYAGTEIVSGEARTSAALPPLGDWLARLRQSPLCGKGGDFAPLILDRGPHLYLARYWHYEKTLADRLSVLALDPGEVVDTARIRSILDRLFDPAAEPPDLQKRAAAVAVLRRFCVISGGPGTGKTSTVVRILAALQALAGEQPLRIVLAAPTGKAAARVQEAIRAQKAGLDLPQFLLAAIPDDAGTLHRLLGARPDSVYFRHHRGNPLPVDVVVVDEASMIDLALMAKLVDALPPTARLILLGDKDQLAAVEAGSVFADLSRTSGYGMEFAERLAQASGVPTDSGGLFVPPLSECVALLTRSYRFKADSGIGQLAGWVNRGQVKRASDLMARGDFPDLAFERESRRRKTDWLDRMERGYRAFFEAVDGEADPGEVLRAFDGFRVLTAHRLGERGAAGINRGFEQRLAARRRMRPGTRWYPGRPVMVARNDYDLRLFNGDVGIALGKGEELRIYFQDADGRVRGFAPGRLPEHDTVYAMTVHKSQGSEFDEVLLLLPEIDSPVLDRPLIYTGLTRARRRVEIHGTPAILAAAIRRLPVRESGLAERLRGL